MRIQPGIQKKTPRAMTMGVALAFGLAAFAPLFGQAPPPPPPSYPPQELDWADQHHYLTGDALARAISDDHLPWDPSVQAMLPFPSVLDMMASDMGWTSELGNAFLAQQPELMDAVQRERHRAYDYGYLRTNPQIIVNGGPYIEILPANPNFIVLRSADRLCPAAARLLCWRRHRFPFRHRDRPRFSALGMGREPLCVGRAPGVYQRCALGSLVGESGRLCSPLRHAAL